MVYEIASIILGITLLVWSADRFVLGASSTAKIFGVPSLLIGMVIVGFGTSAPEMVVSTLAATAGSTGIALGNAYGSNIVNIALILAVTALINPVKVNSVIIKKELPILIAVTVITILLLLDLKLNLIDAIIFITLFLGLVSWSIYQSLKQKTDPIAIQLEQELPKEHALSLKMSLLWLIVGLVILIISSRLLVWGAVEIAGRFGVSDMIIGLTIVAVGTSLPELASSVMAARKGEHDLALGNIIGSNLFNTLAVVGIAGIIHPTELAREILTRDLAVMLLVTIILFFFCYGFKNREAKVTRLEAAILLLIYIVYTGWLIYSA